MAQLNDKWQALNAFWNSFTIPAYDENSVPDGTPMPYITYGGATDSWDYPVPIIASIWYRSTSWTAISQKAEEIAKAIAENGYYITPIEGGYMAIWKNNVFAQRMTDPDDSVRRILLSVTVEYLTAY